MLRKIKLCVIAAALLTPSVATARTKSDPKWCYGTFIRDTCGTSGGTGQCAFPVKKGDRQEFMGWDIEDGVRVYAVYRLTSYPAKDVKIDSDCHPVKW